MRKNLLIIIFVGLTQLAFAQVEKVSYSIEYNVETCLFDCYMNIEEGSTSRDGDRIQFGAQYTVVAPKNSFVQIAENYMPLIGNRNNNGNTPTKWNINSLVEGPVSNPNDAYFSISPAQAPTSYYNNLKEGDKVRLFSVKISPMVDCASGVRIFDNSKGPKSYVPGMRGGDFSNGFTMGGRKQKYSGNLPAVYPAKPTIDKFDISLGNQVNINTEVSHQGKSACQSNLSYQWFSPKGLMGTSKEFPTLNNKDIENGIYKLVVTDDLGCKAEKTFTLSDDSSDTYEEFLAVEKTDEVGFSSSIFPNPSTNVVNLKIEGKPGAKVNVSINTMNGMVISPSVLNERLSSSVQEFSIPTGLKSGLYNIGVSFDNEPTVYHKLIIVE